MYDVDVILTGERFRHILKDLSLEDFDSIETLIEEFTKFAEDDFSDSFVYKMQTLCRFLIDIKAYDYVSQILSLAPIIGTFESEEHDGEECVVTYAIRNIDDENIITHVIKDCKIGELTVYFYEFDFPSIIAIDQKKYKVLKLLFENQLCNEERCYGRWTALQHAAHNRNYELAEILLTDLKHDPNLYGIIDIPPIALAADANDFKMVELLIKHGANVSITDGSGRTAICYCRSDKMLEIFKANGAERENLQMRTIFRIISNIKQEGTIPRDLINSLLTYKQPLFSNKDYNIIVLAAKYGDIESLKSLSSYFSNAKPDDIIRAAFDSYIIDDIIYRKDIDTLIQLTDILIKSGIKSECSNTILSPFHSLSIRPELFMHSQKDKAFALFENVSKLGYSLDECDCLGQNIFHDALENLNVVLINYCLSKGMKYSELDTDNISAVAVLLNHSICCSEFKEANVTLVENVLKNLISNGCNINHQDKYGNTPLHKMAKSHIFKGYTIKLLIKNQADATLKNFMNDTAYDIGVRRGLPDEILKLLKV